MASTSQQAPDRPLCLLSLGKRNRVYIEFLWLLLTLLDGGGIRGLSGLLILKEIMHRVEVRLRNPATAQDPTSKPLPADYFDIICGTSTGGQVHRRYGAQHY